MKLKVFQDKNNLILDDVECFDVPLCLDCGQAFRWQKGSDNIWQGVACGKFLRISQEGNKVTLYNTTENDFNNLWRKYFDLDRDYNKIIRSYDDESLMVACETYPGIRILKQDEWEALCSFIISANNNIPRIKGIINRLCEQFGDEIDGGYTFPTAEKLSTLTVEDLAPIRSGFRAKYIIDAAKKVANGEVNLEALKDLPYEKAQAELLKIKGVGPKVADCALLFSHRHIDAFPKDVWIKKALTVLFGGELPKEAVPYAGIVQQYIFFYARETKLNIN